MQVPPLNASILGAVNQSLPQVPLPRPPSWEPRGDFALTQYFSTASPSPLFTPNTHASPENSKGIVLGDSLSFEVSPHLQRIWPLPGAVPWGNGTWWELALSALAYFIPVSDYRFDRYSPFGLLS